MNKVKYKVLRNDLISPYLTHQYELGKWYHEPNLGEMGESDCYIGLYATDIEGLLYRGVWRKNESVFRCEVKGKKVGEVLFKTCYEYLRIVEKVPEEEVRELARAEHDRLGYLLEECLYPINPLIGYHPKKPTDEDLELLKQWISVWNSMKNSPWRSIRTSIQDSMEDSIWRGSVWCSIKDSMRDNVRGNVWNSIWGSVRGSVWGSVWDSARSNVRSDMRDSVWGSLLDNMSGSVEDSMEDSIKTYMGSLFPNIDKWKYINHKPGKYPFKCGSDLWRRGFVPSFDGEIWRLHSGEKAEVVWENSI